jgi:hypothetical protein
MCDQLQRAEGPTMRNVSFDLAAAIRRLRRDPAFSALAVLTLSVGIAGVVAVQRTETMEFFRRALIK